MKLKTQNMTDNKRASLLRVILMDLIFSFGINFFYIIASILSNTGLKIGGYGGGDGGMIWVLFIFLWTIQFIISFVSLTIVEIVGKEKKRNKKIYFYAFSNSFIIICILNNFTKPVFEGNNTIFLFNLIVYVGFILLYHNMTEKNLSGKLDGTERVEKKSLNERIRDIFPNTRLLNKF